jgi:AcrR family transcriptional regulator
MAAARAQVPSSVGRFMGPPVRLAMTFLTDRCEMTTMSRNLTTMPRQGPRRLDHDQVVAAAERVVDELGWDHLTMAALATALGTTGPSLYNHVTSLEALRGELQERTMRRLGEQLAGAALARSGRPAFLALAAAYRSFVKRHPNRYDGATRPPVDREGLRAAAEQANRALLAVVRSYGVEPSNAHIAQLGALAALHGVVTLEVSGFLGDAVDPDVLYDAVVATAERQLTALALQLA